MRNFCTLFNSNYKFHACSLYDSLNANHTDFNLYCLCMDEISLQYIKKKKLSNLIAISITEVEIYFPQLLQAKKNRGLVEYFFTCTSAICKYLLDVQKDIEEIVYLDADLYFFDTPEIIFDEIKDASISIIPHRFKGINKLRNIFGYYNVGWVSFKKDENGLACVNDWFNKCIDWCYDKLEKDKYADQKYLNEWPKKFKNVCVIQNIGANAAPWNIGNYSLIVENDKILVDKTPLVFYHYAGLKFIDNYFYTTCSSYFSKLSECGRNNIYLVYLNKLNSLGYVPQTNLRQKRNFFHNTVRKFIRFVFKDKIKFINNSDLKDNILFILHLPSPIHGASVMGQLIKESDHINSNFNTTYINLSTSKSIHEIGKHSIRKLGITLIMFLDVLRLLITNKYDLVYISMTANPPGFFKDFLLVLLVKLFNRKIVYHHHNKGFSVFSKNRLIAFCYRIVFKNTRSILLSEKLFPDIKQFVSPKHVYYVPNGIKDVTYSNLIMDSAPSIISILFLSNMMESKGVYVLVNACEILKQRNVLFRCQFIGSWADVSEADFNQIIDRKGLQNEVKALGPKFGVEKENYFKNSQIFVFPTHYSLETFGLVAVEAMQHQLPLIVSNVGALPDIVDDGINGYVIEEKNPKLLADKIEFLINNPVIRNEMGQNAYEKYKLNYTLSHFETSFVTCLQSILKEPVS